MIIEASKLADRISATCTRGVMQHAIHALARRQASSSGSPIGRGDPHAQAGQASSGISQRDRHNGATADGRSLDEWVRWLRENVGGEYKITSHPL